MTIKKRMARSNVTMVVVPVVVGTVLLMLGIALALALLHWVYLPRAGLTFQDLGRAEAQLETLFDGAGRAVKLYAMAVAAVLFGSVALTNLVLTRRLARHITQPLDTLTQGVARIRDGDLDSPIAYGEEDEFRAVCDAVDEMAARLKASLEQQQREQQKKQELIAGMSHDLKSPLTAIRAYAEALRDGMARDEASRARYLQTICTKEREIEAMAERLFAFAKLDVSADPAQLEPLPLGRTMREIVGGEENRDMEIALDIPETLRVQADRVLLRRIAENLLENSRKYAGREDICVRIKAETAEGTAALSFADNGPGVPPEQLPRLFDVFYRGDAARTAPGKGSGIGLAVVKRAAQAMGGDARAENGAQGGLRVTVTLPLAEEEACHG